MPTRLLRAVALAFLLVLGSVAAAQSADILGKRAPETIKGTAGDDDINSLGGNDTILGGGGNDSLDGDRADDRVFGQEGDDGSIADAQGNPSDIAAVRAALLGAPLAADTKRNRKLARLPLPLNVNPLEQDFSYPRKLDGGDGNDRIEGGPGNDVIVEAGLGHDTIDGGEGDDLIRAGNAPDRIDAGPGDDVVDGGSGVDTIQCGPGNDIVLWDNASEFGPGSRGGGGKISGCETFVRVAKIPSRTCRKKGTDNAELLRGGTGRDTCYGQGGDDLIEGDTTAGSAGDRLYGGRGNDMINGRGGNDTIRGEQGDDELNGDRNDDTLYGGEGNDEVNGGLGRDTLYGGPGNDVLAPGHSARGELADCGPGYDVVYLGPGDRQRNCEKVIRSYKGEER